MFSRPYDAWNRLVDFREDDADPQTPETTIDDECKAGWQVIEERVNGVVHAQYLWCLSYIDPPVLRGRDTTGNEELDETLCYTVDANKNVTVLIDEATGQVVERYLYVGDQIAHSTFGMENKVYENLGDFLGALCPGCWDWVFWE